jgi:hypothetical protein
MFEPTRLAPGTSAARTSSGLTGGVAVDAAASFEVASSAGAGTSGLSGRIPHATALRAVAGRYFLPKMTEPPVCVATLVWSQRGLFVCACVQPGCGGSFASFVYWSSE